MAKVILFKNNKGGVNMVISQKKEIIKLLNKLKIKQDKRKK